LGHLLDRLGTVESLDEIVVATTADPRDDVLSDFVLSRGIKVYRGSEEDVMDRVLRAAYANAASTIAEITADCPLLDPQIVSQVVNIHEANAADYTSNAHVRSYPDGMDVEVFSTEVLQDSYHRTADPLHREHVSLHIREHPELYRQVHVVAPDALVWPELGLTLDEPDDFLLISEVIREFRYHSPGYTCGDIVAFLKGRPDLVSLNSSVKRKGDT